jgi:hypothetical protein
MYSHTSPTYQSRTLPFTLPLDPSLPLGATNANPRGEVRFHQAWAEETHGKTVRTLGLESTEVNDGLKLTALEQLLELLSRPQKVQSLLEAGIFAELILNAANENTAIRVLSSAALASLTAARAGREYALQADIVPRLAKLVGSEEPSPKVRWSILQTLCNMASSQAGVRHLLSRDVCALLVSRVSSESDLSCCAGALDVLIVMVREPLGWEKAMEDRAVETCATVLRALLTASETLSATESVAQSEGGCIVATALKPRFQCLGGLAKLIGNIAAVALKGKDRCVGCDIVPLLVSLLGHPVSSLRIHASFALQNLANAESGKRAMLEAQAMAPLLEACLADQEEMVQCQSLQALASLSEHPAAKNDDRVQQAIPELKEVQGKSASEKVRHAAKLAVDQITWLP